MTHFTILNQSTVIDDSQIPPLTVALRAQASAFAKHWPIQTVSVGWGKPTAGAWVLVILDDSDQANALGYHDLTADGLPVGKVFARTDQTDLSWTVTASHEFLEMLADPWINLASQTGASTFYGTEVCDPCEADQFGYSQSGVQVSDFVTPAWFIPGMKGPYDHAGHLSAPLELLPGGYASVFKGGKWTQTFRRSAGVSRRARSHRHVRRSAGGLRL